MHNLLFKIFIGLNLLYSTRIFGIENCGTENTKKDLTETIYKLEKENAILKNNLEIYISESDKRMTLFTTLASSLVVLLIVIYGFGAYRSTQLAKQEAQKAFKEDFAKIKNDIESLKKEAEKELVEIVTLKEIAKSKIE